MSETGWTPEYRVDVARKIATTLRDEACGVISSWRAAEMGEVLLFVLSMPESFLIANASKFAEWTQ